MLDALLSYAAGIITSIAANYVWEWYQKRGYRALRRRLPKLPSRQSARQAPAGYLRLGRTDVPWVVCAYGPYEPENIELFYNPHELKKPQEVQELYRKLAADVRRREAKGEPAPFNGLGYQLEKFFVGSRRGEHEDPVLRLYFRPTDYFTMLVTDNRLDEPLVVNNTKTTLRKKYASGMDLAYSPVPEFATHFGVGLMIVTADEKMVFSERGPTATDSFVFFPSVAEGSSRPADALRNGGPDPYRTAVRGIAEELGIEVNPGEVKFLSFGANAVLCEYALCGVVYVRQTAQELMEIRSLGIPKDRWESQRLHFVPFSPDAVGRFIASHKPWSPFALVCAAHALYDAYGKEALERCFRNASIALSQELPRD